MSETESGFVRALEGVKRHPVMIGAGVAVTALAMVVSFTGNVRELLGLLDKPEVVVVDGRWVSDELTNPFDPAQRFRLVFDLQSRGAAVLGNLAERRADGRAYGQQGLLEGTLDGRSITFHTLEQSLYGSETVSFRNLYQGAVEDGAIRFTLMSDRPWGFPAQSFVARRE